MLRADLAYLDSSYKNFRNAPCKSADILARTCGTASLGGAGHVGPGARRIRPSSAAASAPRSTLPFGANQLRIDPSVYFTSGYFMNAAADPLLRQGGYSKYDLRMGYGPEDAQLGSGLVGKNLSDKETLGVMLEMPGAPGTVTGFPERGRSIAAAVLLPQLSRS